MVTQVGRLLTLVAVAAAAGAWFLVILQALENPHSVERAVDDRQAAVVAAINASHRAQNLASAQTDSVDQMTIELTTLRLKEFWRSPPPSASARPVVGFTPSATEQRLSDALEGVRQRQAISARATDSLATLAGSLTASQPQLIAATTVEGARQLRRRALAAVFLTMLAFGVARAGQIARVFGVA